MRCDLAASVTLRFVMPRQLLQSPIYTWWKEHCSGDPHPLALDYAVIMRSLERMQAKHWQHPWRTRWDSMLENPTVEQIHSVGASRPGDNPINAVLSDSRWIGLWQGTPARPGPRRTRGAERDTGDGPSAIWWYAPARFERGVKRMSF
ncbi:hypothetical protein ACFOWZ_10550 [Lentzea rhizosphaerae]|uniref:vWA-MoxR associated protein C-terminal domain-containing protein n=1 Tax=Lentzea rhizosphaerae TaxID=2041025 RepID=A0ABV8BRF9_9PSEU